MNNMNNIDVLDINKKEEILLSVVDKLNEFDIQDDVPCIQFPSSSVEMDVTPLQNPVNFADHPAFGAQFSEGNTIYNIILYFLSFVL